MIYRVKMTKIQSDHNNVRTNEVVGITSSLPKIGERFQILSEALDKSNGANARYVETSPIESLKSSCENTIIMKTHYSTYELEILA